MNVVDLRTERNRRGVYVRMDFDTLDCFVCDVPVPPKSVSKGPTVAYRCAACGSSWRINAEGDMTHARRKTAD